MEWTIRVKPIDSELTHWTWTAERADGQSTRFSRTPLASSEAALEEAQQEVRATERRISRISDATIEQVYQPTPAELMVAE